MSLSFFGLNSPISHLLLIWNVLHPSTLGVVSPVLITSWLAANMAPHTPWDIVHLMTLADFNFKMSFDLPNIINEHSAFINSSFVSHPCFHLLYSTFFFYTETQSHTPCLTSLVSWYYPELIFLSNTMIHDWEWGGLYSKGSQLSRASLSFRGATHVIPCTSFLNEVHSDFLKDRVYVLLLSCLRTLCFTISCSRQPKLLLVAMSPRSSWMSRVDLVEV